MKTNLRLRLFYWIVYDLFNHEEGMLLPWYLVMIRYILLPIDTMQYRRKGLFWYDPGKDIFYIYDQKYSGKLFRCFALWKIGSKFQLIQREDGLITLKDLNEI